MANGADWRNLHQTHTNAVNTNKVVNDNINSREKKFENLSSNIFGDEDSSQRPVYNPEVEKQAIGTDTNWMQAG